MADFVKTHCATIRLENVIAITSQIVSKEKQQPFTIVKFLSPRGGEEITVTLQGHIGDQFFPSVASYELDIQLPPKAYLVRGSSVRVLSDKRK